MFDDMLTQAIKIGMSPYDFWHSEPSLYYNYLEAYEEKQKEEYNKVDYVGWINGTYIYRAIAANNPLIKEHEGYPSEPFSMTKEKEKQKEEEKEKLSPEEREKFEQELAIREFEQFGRYAEVYNQKYFEEEEGG